MSVLFYAIRVWGVSELGIVTSVRESLYAKRKNLIVVNELMVKKWELIFSL